MTLPRVLYQSEDQGGAWRIVQVQIPEKQREPKIAGEAPDDGIREYIELADGYDLMGQRRWQRIEKKTEGVGTYDRLVHALKRELLRLHAQLETETIDA
jgi:hypothetical protein